jgi:hypothetical protein
MKHKTLISRIEKIGIKVENYGDRTFVARGKNVVTWYKQDDLAICVRTPSKHTDIDTDCFCDIYHRKVKSVLSWLAYSL